MTNPTTAEEIGVVCLYMLSLTRRPDLPANAYTLDLARSWLWEDFATLRNRLPIRHALGYTKTTQSLGRTRFFDALRAVSDVADDDQPAVRTKRRGNDKVADLVLLSLDEDDWDDLLDSIQNPSTGADFDGVLDALQVTEALNLISTEPVPEHAIATVVPLSRLTQEHLDQQDSAPRRCWSCSTVKPVTEFSPENSACRSCKRQRAADRRAANLPQAREADADRQSAHRAGLRSRSDAQLREDRVEEKWCHGCKTTHHESTFAKDFSRRDCLSFYCSAYMYRRSIK